MKGTLCTTILRIKTGINIGYNRKILVKINFLKVETMRAGLKTNPDSTKKKSTNKLNPRKYLWFVSHK
jgi:hypothetical protein